MDPHPQIRRKKGCFAGCAFVSLVPVLLICFTLCAALGFVSLPSRAVSLGNSNGLRLDIRQMPSILATDAQDINIGLSEHSTNFDYQTGITVDCTYSRLYMGRLMTKLENCSVYMGKPGTMPSLGVSPVPTSAP